MRARLTGGIWTAGMMTLAMSGTAPALSAGQARGPVTVTASADIDGKRYEYSGPGECHYTTQGSIYDEPATMWHASFNAHGKAWANANLSIWQLKQGRTIRMNLSALAGSGSYNLSTAKPGESRGTAVGSAENSASGGRLTGEGRTPEGKMIKMTISCSRFDAPEDNGD